MFRLPAYDPVGIAMLGTRSPGRCSFGICLLARPQVLFGLNQNLHREMARASRI